MHEQRQPLSTEAEDQRDARSVFTHLIGTQPDTLRLSDLILELGESEEFDQRDRIEIVQSAELRRARDAFAQFGQRDR